MKFFQKGSIVVLALVSPKLLTACGLAPGGGGNSSGGNNDANTDLATNEGATQAQLAALEDTLLALINNERTCRN